MFDKVLHLQKCFPHTLPDVRAQLIQSVQNLVCTVLLKSTPPSQGSVLSGWEHMSQNVYVLFGKVLAQV